MSNEADLADREAEVHFKAALSKRRFIPPVTGSCLFCATPLDNMATDVDDLRWCDADCRDDWEKERKINGLPY